MKVGHEYTINLSQNLSVELDTSYFWCAKLCQEVKF